MDTRKQWNAIFSVLKKERKKTTKTQYLQSAIKPGAIKRGMSVHSIMAVVSGL